MSNEPLREQLDAIPPMPESSRSMTSEPIKGNDADEESPPASQHSEDVVQPLSLEKQPKKGCNCTVKCCAIGSVIFLLVATLGAVVFIRIVFRGFFSPRCARPRRTIDSMDSLDSCLNDIYDKYDFKGISVAISTDQGTAWTQSYGYANVEDDRLVTAETPFLLSSISKTFVATSIMQLVEQGVLDLDEDINTYLPFSVVNPRIETGSPITLRSLSTHTSGIVDSDVYDAIYGPGDPEQGLREFLVDYLVPGGNYYSEGDNFGNCLPGKCSYEYSNIGASLAGFVVEAATGISYADYVEQHILQPLGMDDSHFYLANYTDPDGTIAMPYEESGGKVEEYGFYGYPTYPDGRLFTSASDMAKYMTSLMGENQDLMSLETRNDMFTPQNIDQKIELIEKIVFGKLEQEIFWVKTNGKNHGYDGGDYGSFTLMYFEPVHKVGIVILTNYAGMNGSIALMQIIKQVTRQSKHVMSLLNKL